MNKYTLRGWSAAWFITCGLSIGMGANPLICFVCGIVQVVIFAVTFTDVID